MTEVKTITSGNIQITTGHMHPIKAWTVGVDVEQHAQAQLANVANLPFIFKHVAVMPDVHAGYGATIGSVIPTVAAVVPMMVGVDIGCGICAVRTTLTREKLPDNTDPLEAAIDAAVPNGISKRRGGRDKGSWGEPPPEVEIAWMELEPGYRKLIEKHPRLSHKGPQNQLGTLGSGNHFIEVCEDEEGAIWFMLHSGSRGPGNRIGTYFGRVAKEQMNKYFITLPDYDLSYLPEGTRLYDDYLEAASWAQRYAKVNRELMMQQIVQAVRRSKLCRKFDLEDPIDCHHNYVTREKHFGHNVLVTRKGAVCAREGMMGIIPGSMGAKSYITRGKGNPESFNSCSHGAGRLMSRAKAKQTFTLKDHRKATEGISCRKDGDILDETPGAYKPIEDVMKAQEDLVEPVHTLRQLVCVKG
jgi:tRNA-splicing ligase RtcB